MSIFSHNVYDNVRTRVIVINEGRLLLLEPYQPGAGWQLPGGGLEPHESLADCAQREVFEETGIKIAVTRVAFLREFVVPRYCVVPDGGDGFGYGLEIYLYAHPATDQLELHLERPGAQPPHWIPFGEVPGLPVWPKELKTLSAMLASGKLPYGAPLFVSQLESPDAPAPDVTFA
jgi:8-oxo-dGTP pyrophosphatase MutT (NUDIX family)